MKKREVKKKRKTFEEYYFEESPFGRAMGEFTKESLDLSRKWFWGWFNYFNQFADFKNGNNKKVLEIGCAIGGAASILSERGFDVYATDVSRYAIIRAKKLTPQVKFSQVDIEKKIPFKFKFDIILSFEVIEHLKDPLKAVTKMQKSVKEGGVVICSTPPLEHPGSFDDPTHISVKNAKQWKKLFKQAGFKKVEVKHVTLVPVLWRYSKYLSIIIPFGIIFKRYLNSPLFIIAKN